MPQSSAWALQEAVHQHLVADANLVSQLGGARIYDHVPRNAAYPLISFGRSSARDWSTGSEDGEEHILTLHVWSEGGSRQQTHTIMDGVRRALNDATLTLTDHRLIQIRHELSEARPEPDREGYRGLIRYRAVTEPT